MDPAQKTHPGMIMTLNECRTWPGKDQVANEIGFASSDRLVQFLKENHIREDSFKTLYKHSHQLTDLKNAIDNHTVKKLTDKFDNAEGAIKSAAELAWLIEEARILKEEEQARMRFYIVIALWLYMIVDFLTRRGYI